MSYLEPPPLPSPVVVTKDVGGLVSDYRDRTALYRAQNRDVRLHECRSACTLALSLPNVCVYPSSLLKFHQAYNQITNEVDLGISDELWQSYPLAVRARLGTLTRVYKVIRGDELIALGVRDCTAPQEKIMVARARTVPLPPQPTSSVFASLGDTLSSLVTPSAPTLVPTKPVAPPKVPEPRPPPDAAAIPEPPPRPVTPIPPLATPAQTTLGTTIQTTLDVPLPPPRPPLLAQAEPRMPAGKAASLPPFRRPIAGSQPILPIGFSRVAAL